MHTKTTVVRAITYNRRYTASTLHRQIHKDRLHGLDHQPQVRYVLVKWIESWTMSIIK